MRADAVLTWACVSFSSSLVLRASCFWFISSSSSPNESPRWVRHTRSSRSLCSSSRKKWGGQCLMDQEEEENGGRYLPLVLGRLPQGVQVSVGVQLGLHGGDLLLQGAELPADLPLQLLHLLQVLLQPLGLWRSRGWRGFYTKSFLTAAP